MVKCRKFEIVLEGRSFSFSSITCRLLTRSERDGGADHHLRLVQCERPHASKHAERPGLPGVRGTAPGSLGEARLGHRDGGGGSGGDGHTRDWEDPGSEMGHLWPSYLRNSQDEEPFHLMLEMKDRRYFGGKATLAPPAGRPSAGRHYLMYASAGPDWAGD